MARYGLKGSIERVLASVEVHQESTGLIFATDLAVEEISVGGTHVAYPGTFLDPPEDETEVVLSFDRMAHRLAPHLGQCTVLTPAREIQEQVSELVDEIVREDLERFLTSAA